MSDPVATIQMPTDCGPWRAANRALYDYSEDELVERIKRRLVARYGRPATAA